MIQKYNFFWLCYIVIFWRFTHNTVTLVNMTLHKKYQPPSVKNGFVLKYFALKKYKLITIKHRVRNSLNRVKSNITLQLLNEFDYSTSWQSTSYLHTCNWGTHFLINIIWSHCVLTPSSPWQVIINPNTGIQSTRTKTPVQYCLSHVLLLTNKYVHLKYFRTFHFLTYWIQSRPIQTHCHLSGYSTCVH